MYPTSSTLRFSIIALILCASVQWSRAAVARSHPEVPDIDTRITGQQLTLTPERAAGLERVRARIPDIQVDLDEIIGSPKWIRSQRGFLTGPKVDPRDPQATVPAAVGQAEVDDPHEPAKRFLNEHAALFGHGAEVLANARITREFVGEHNGLRTVV